MTRTISLALLALLFALSACGYDVRRDENFTPLQIGVHEMLYIADVPASKAGQFLALLGDHRFSARDGGSLGNGYRRVLLREDQQKKFRAFAKHHEGLILQHGVRLRIE